MITIDRSEHVFQLVKFPAPPIVAGRTAAERASLSGFRQIPPPYQAAMLRLLAALVRYCRARDRQ